MAALVASNTRGLRFESSHWQILFSINCIKTVMKRQNKEKKRPEWPICLKKLGRWKKEFELFSLKYPTNLFLNILAWNIFERENVTRQLRELRNGGIERAAFFSQICHFGDLAFLFFFFVPSSFVYLFLSLCLLEVTTFLSLLREMEYKGHASYNTFYPLQNKHQILWHYRLLRCCVLWKSKYSESHEMG